MTHDMLRVTYTNLPVTSFIIFYLIFKWNILYRYLLSIEIHNMSLWSKYIWNLNKNYYTYRYRLLLGILTKCQWNLNNMIKNLILNRFYITMVVWFKKVEKLGPLELFFIDFRKLNMSLVDKIMTSIIICVNTLFQSYIIIHSIQIILKTN